MNTHISKARRVAAVALAVAIVPFAASTASAATKTTQGKRATWTKASTTTPATTAAAASTTTTTQAPVTAIHAIGGYIFVNVTYLEAVELYFKAVAAAPAGYTPPPVTSISATTTVSGTVADPQR